MSDAIYIVNERFKCKTANYKEIKDFAIENTMYNENQIIKCIIKPLIDIGIVTKANIKGIKNYKEDRYIFKK